MFFRALVGVLGDAAVFRVIAFDGECFFAKTSRFTGLRWSAFPGANADATLVFLCPSAASLILSSRADASSVSIAGSNASDGSS
jgi:hypothetical protein